MKYKRYDDFCSQTCEPVEMEIVTQPNAALPLREILERFAGGDNSVLSHLPVDDFTDETSDEEFFKDDSFDIPVEPEDRLQAEEFIIQQQENKFLLDSLSKDNEESKKEESKKEESVTRKEDE